MTNSEAPRIHLGPAGGPDWLADAVIAGGGQLVGPDEAEGVVWADAKGVDALRSILDDAGHIRWVQLPFAGIENFVEYLDHDRIWSCGKGVYAEPVAEMARQADTLFREKQYDRAAELYARLLERNPDNVETRNNLGLTLFYLGRREEALRQLREGAAAHPEHQRIWLTLGFVSSQLGNVEEARTALTKATETGGNITMPLEKAPWGDTFGMCTDRFGVNWMVNITGEASS